MIGELPSVAELSPGEQRHLIDDQFRSYRNTLRGDHRRVERRMQGARGAGWISHVARPCRARDLQESVSFYEQTYPFLKSINLSKITENEKDEIITFLDTVFNYQVLIQNNLRFFKFFFGIN
jgi:hypothetical protein